MKKTASPGLWKATTLALATLLTLVVGYGLLGSASAERQPMMQAARRHLVQAKGFLEKASHDKGGHRVRAIGLVNSAIAEVDKGIAFDNRR